MSLAKVLWSRTDNRALVYFRILFGLIIFWEAYRHYTKGWIHYFYITPKFLFTFYGFDWVKPWPGLGMYYHYLALALSALLVTAGLFYRLSSLILFLCLGYIFLLDKSHYLNHAYLLVLIAGIMVFIPAHQRFSLDSLRNSKLRSNTAPKWAFLLLTFQVAVPYFFGGLAKLNTDWLQGLPMRIWLTEKTSFPIIGSYFGEAWVGYLTAYGGLLLDLFVVPALLWRPTRYWAYALTLGFHLFNAFFFSIGVFPWFMIFATLLIFLPNWVPPLPKWKFDRPPLFLLKAHRWKRMLTFSLLSIYIFWQLLMPFRHLLYPGSVLWTGEGELFAWRMKSADIRSYVRFFTLDPETGKRIYIIHREFLTEKQAIEMNGHPDMLLQFSHFLGKHISDQLGRHVPIYIDARASLNGRKPITRILPDVDLSREPRTLLAKRWIAPFQEPLTP